MKNKRVHIALTIVALLVVVTAACHGLPHVTPPACEPTTTTTVEETTTTTEETTTTAEETTTTEPDTTTSTEETSTTAGGGGADADCTSPTSGLPTTTLPSGQASPKGWLFCAMETAGYATMGSGKVMNPVRYTSFPNGQPPCMHRYAINDGEKQFYYNFDVNDQGVLKTIAKIPGATPAARATYGTYWLKDRAVEWWQQTDGPKFLMYSPSAPHAPGTGPDGAPFILEELPNPPNWREGCPGAFDEDASDKPAAVQARECKNAHAAPRNEYPRQALAAADDALEELWATADHDRTIFIVTSDNGMIAGAHKSAGKPTPYEEGLTVPLHVYVPGLPGGVLQRLASNIDLMPTILDLTRAGGVAEGFDVMLVITDDQPCIMDELGVCDTVRHTMPWLTSTVGQPGWYTFPQYRTHTSLCCPGRATIFSGQTSLHNKQLSNSPLTFNMTAPILRFDGTSLVPLLLGDTTGWRTEAYIQHGKASLADGYHGIREDCALAAEEQRPCWVYWERNVTGERELYRLDTDPWQLQQLLPNAVTGYPGVDGFTDSHPVVVDLQARLTALKRAGAS